MTPLTHKHCIPCARLGAAEPRRKGGVPPLTRSEGEELRKQTPGWGIIEDQSGRSGPRTLKISRTFKFKNFKETRAFFNKVADVADTEDHHPDFEVHWGSMTLTLWTHAIGGLSENDFIVAAKIDTISKS